jgi:hypothetical protein
MFACLSGAYFRHDGGGDEGREFMGMAVEAVCIIIDTGGKLQVSPTLQNNLIKMGELSVFACDIWQFLLLWLIHVLHVQMMLTFAIEAYRKHSVE